MDSRSPLSRTRFGSSLTHRVDLDGLIAAFYPGHTADDNPIGRFSRVDSAPGDNGVLLDHNHHMTVTVERYYGGHVDVVVHRHHRDGDWYRREITLVTADDAPRPGRVVQYGIVQLNTLALAPPVWQRIESRTTPLGRCLIEAGVHREVQLQQLWSLEARSAFERFIPGCKDQTVYGRTALILCDGVPGIELLEVVTPP